MARKPAKSKAKKKDRKAAAPKEGRRGTRVAIVSGIRIDGEEAKSFIARIENLKRDLETERSNYMNACKPIHEDIRSIYAEAKAKDISTRALKAVVEARDLERRAEKKRDDLPSTEDANAFDAIRLSLGDLDGTPLGEAAKARAAVVASQEPAGNDAEEDDTASAPESAPASPPLRGPAADAELAKLTGAGLHS